MNNKLIMIQEILMEEMKRLGENNVDSSEVARSNALSNNALTFIKSVNLGLRIKETACKIQVTESTLSKELGVSDEN